MVLILVIKQVRSLGFVQQADWPLHLILKNCVNHDEAGKIKRPCVLPTKTADNMEGCLPTTCGPRLMVNVTIFILVGSAPFSHTAGRFATCSSGVVRRSVSSHGSEDWSEICQSQPKSQPYQR